jgi:hypothetical protein
MRLAFNWPDELVAKIDAARGETSRNDYIRRLTEAKLNAPLRWNISPRPLAKPRPKGKR